MRTKPTLAVDFDGVVHPYKEGWKGVNKIINESPVPGAIAWLREAQQFWTVAVYSTRSAVLEGREAMRRYICFHAAREIEDIDELHAFMEELQFPEHKPPALLMIDDRALRFEGDWSALDPRQLLEFKPWNKR